MIIFECGRELVKYLTFQTENVYVINDDPRTPYKQYLFYTNALNRNTLNQVAMNFRHNTFRLNNIHFITCNQATNIPQGSVVIYSNCKKLPVSKNNVTIAQLSDGGSIYTISNDNVCSKYVLNNYPYNISFADLAIEKLSKNEFCQKFITKY